MPVVSMGAAYAGFLVWRLRDPEDPALVVVLLFACTLWTVYTAAVFLSRHEAFADAKRAAFLSVNNAALLGLLAWETLGNFEPQFWILPMALAAALLDPEGLDGLLLASRARVALAEQGGRDQERRSQENVIHEGQVGELGHEAADHEPIGDQGQDRGHARAHPGGDDRRVDQEHYP